MYLYKEMLRFFITCIVLGVVFLINFSQSSEADLVILVSFLSSQRLGYSCTTIKFTAVLERKEQLSTFSTH